MVDGDAAVVVYMATVKVTGVLNPRFCRGGSCGTYVSDYPGVLGWESAGGICISS